MSEVFSPEDLEGLRKARIVLNALVQTGSISGALVIMCSGKQQHLPVVAGPSERNIALGDGRVLLFRHPVPKLPSHAQEPQTPKKA
jgi:hypothetical protein